MKLIQALARYIRVLMWRFMAGSKGILPWIRDAHDARDYKVANCKHFTLLPLDAVPAQASLRDRCSDVEDQGALGSCTGNAIVGIMEFIDNSLRRGERGVNLSRLFVYYCERYIEGTVDVDRGASLRDGIKAVAEWGVCGEDLWPYQIQNFAYKPSDTAYADAATRKVKAYARVSRDMGIAEIKRVIASGYPVVFGFRLFSQIAEAAATGELNMPGPLEQAVGGHAVVAVGYDDATQRVLVRNSWGAGWGNGGYFTMPYDYVSNRDLANDFWVVTY